MTSAEERKVHARKVNRWRGSHPQQYTAAKNREADRRRALARLGERYPEELAGLVEQCRREREAEEAR